jgi:hypothetical protein
MPRKRSEQAAAAVVVVEAECRMNRQPEGGAEADVVEESGGP